MDNLLDDIIETMVLRLELGQIHAQTGVQHLLARSSQGHLLGSLTTGP